MATIKIITVVFLVLFVIPNQLIDSKHRFKLIWNATLASYGEAS